MASGGTEDIRRQEAGKSHPDSDGISRSGRSWLGGSDGGRSRSARACGPSSPTEQLPDPWVAPLAHLCPSRPSDTTVTSSLPYNCSAWNISSGFHSLGWPLIATVRDRGDCWACYSPSRWSPCQRLPGRSAGINKGHTGQRRDLVLILSALGALNHQAIATSH